MQHALLQALSLWPFKGVPERPEAWLATVAKNRALDLLRGEGRQAALAEDLVPLANPSGESEGRFDRELNDVIDAYKDIKNERSREYWSREAALGAWEFLWGERGARKAPDLDGIARAQIAVEAPELETVSGD